MSSNDYISIVQASNGKYLITHRDADTHEDMERIGVSSRLENAVDRANKWQHKTGSFVEYGLFIPNPKKGERNE